MDNPTITMKHCRSNLDQENQSAPVNITNSTYLWDAEEQSYCDGGGSCGGHGAKLKDGKWLPFWTPADSDDTQFGFKCFGTAIEAIHEAYSTWS